LEERLQQLERGLTALSENETHRLQDVSALEGRIQSVSNELAEQQAKRDRAQRQCQKCD
jgi:septal ring factor EnvC (AmiA/AmiB activator)